MSCDFRRVLMTLVLCLAASTSGGCYLASSVEPDPQLATFEAAGGIDAVASDGREPIGVEIDYTLEYDGQDRSSNRQVLGLVRRAVARHPRFEEVPDAPYVLHIHQVADLPPGWQLRAFGSGLTFGWVPVREQVDSVTRLSLARRDGPAVAEAEVHDRSVVRVGARIPFTPSRGWSTRYADQVIGDYMLTRLAEEVNDATSRLRPAR